MTHKPYEVFEGILVHKQYPQWIVWRKVPREHDRFGKAPYNPRTGKEASTSNLKTWATFAEAVQAVERGNYDGIGFILTENDPFERLLPLHPNGGLEDRRNRNHLQVYLVP